MTKTMETEETETDDLDALLAEDAAEEADAATRAADARAAYLAVTWATKATTGLTIYDAIRIVTDLGTPTSLEIAADMQDFAADETEVRSALWAAGIITENYSF